MHVLAFPNDRATAAMRVRPECDASEARDDEDEPVAAASEGSSRGDTAGGSEAGETVGDEVSDAQREETPPPPARTPRHPSDVYIEQATAELAAMGEAATGDAQSELNPLTGEPNRLIHPRTRQGRAAADDDAEEGEEEVHDGEAGDEAGGEAGGEAEGEEEGEAGGGEGGELAVGAAVERPWAPKDTAELLQAIAETDYGLSDDRSAKLATPAIKAYNGVADKYHQALQKRGQLLHEGFTIVKVRAARLACMCSLS